MPAMNPEAANYYPPLEGEDPTNVGSGEGNPQPSLLKYSKILKEKADS
jgi:hypothetical protein